MKWDNYDCIKGNASCVQVKAEESQEHFKNDGILHHATLHDN